MCNHRILNAGHERRAAIKACHASVPIALETSHAHTLIKYLYFPSWVNLTFEIPKLPTVSPFRLNQALRIYRRPIPSDAKSSSEGVAPLV